MRIQTELTTAVSIAGLICVLALAVAGFKGLHVLEQNRSLATMRDVARDVTERVVTGRHYGRNRSDSSAVQWDQPYSNAEEKLMSLKRDMAAYAPEISALQESMAVLGNIAAQLKSLPDEPDREFQTSRRTQLIDSYSTRARNMTEEIFRLEDKVVAEQDLAVHELIFIAISSPLLLTAGVLLMSVSVVQRVLMPLKKIKNATLRVGQGDLSMKIANHVADELGELSRLFDSMTQQLGDNNRSLLDANRRLKDALAEREEKSKRLELIGANIPVLFAYVTRDERFACGNAAYSKIYDVDIADAAGKHLVEILGPAVYAQSREFILRAISGERVQFERTIQCAENGIRHERVTYIPDTPSGTKVLGFFSLAEDITEFRRVESVLAESERRLRTVMEDSPLGIFITDASGKMEYANPALQKIAGLPPNGNVGDFWTSAIYPNDREQARIAWENSVRAGGPFQSEFRFRKSNGEISWVRVNAAAIRGENNSTTHIGMVENVTVERLKSEEIRSLNRNLEKRVAARTQDLQRISDEQRELLGELEQRALAQQRLIYILSHDLREPLNAIGNFTRMIVSTQLPNLTEDGQRHFNFIMKSAARMKTLLDDLLKYVRLEKGEFAPVQVDMDKLMADVKADLYSALERTNATLDWDASVVVKGDNTLLRVLVENLVSNAIKFNRPGVKPFVHVEVRSSDTNWLIKVRDNGIGIVADQLERIFELFARLHLRDKYEGTGLGLAIAKRIAEMHGGSISVESVVGSGTCFTVVLPKNTWPLNEMNGARRPAPESSRQGRQY